MEIAILARLEALEQRLEELSRPALHFDPPHLEPSPDIMSLYRVKAFAGEALPSATIEIKGEIDRAMREKIEDRLSDRTAARHLEIRIDSPGGDFHQAMAVYRALQWAPAFSKHVFMESRCCSAAIIVAMAGDRRIARPDTELLIHLCGSFPAAEKRWTSLDYAEGVRVQSAYDRRMLSLIAKRTGAEFDELAREASHERPSSLAWCLQHGLVHKVEPAA